MRLRKNWLFILVGMVILLGMIVGLACTIQAQLWPFNLSLMGYPFSYPSFPFIRGNYYQQVFPLPFYGGNFGWGYNPASLINPMPALLSTYQRAPRATVIFASPTLTSVSTTPGVILIGATGVIGAPTAIAPQAIASAVAPSPVIAAPAPAPLFSVLAVLYASALLDGHALLSTANPLLFAYLSSLVL